MTKKNLLKGIEDGNVFIDIDNDLMTVYHEVLNDKYYIENEDGIQRATLVAEVRYNTDCEPNDEDLLDGNFDEIGEFDCTGEFDNPIETSGLYIFRYGYFRYINSNKEDVVTKLIDLTE